MNDLSSRPNEACRIERECVEWPQQDRNRWRAIFGSQARFALSVEWAEATRRQVAWVYSQYIRHVRDLGLKTEVAQDGVQSFASAALTRGCGLRTVANYVQCIEQALSVLRSGGSRRLDWLRDLSNALNTAAKNTPKKKAGRQRPADDILNLGLAEMEQADLASNSWHDSKRYRDGLILALWICMPERRRAFTAIRLQDLSADLTSIDFPAEHQKTGEAIRRVIPDFLRPHLRRYLDEIRCIHANNHDRLWIVEGGNAAGSETLYRAVVDMTKTRFGIALSPHRLRDCAARFVVEEMTSEARLASVILNHRDARSTAPYLEGAKTLSASRKAMALLHLSRAKALSR